MITIRQKHRRYSTRCYAAELRGDGQIFTFAGPDHSSLHADEETARRWLGDHSLRKSKAKQLLAAAIRNEGPFADPENKFRTTNVVFSTGEFRAAALHQTGIASVQQLAGGCLRSTARP